MVTEEESIESHYIPRLYCRWLKASKIFEVVSPYAWLIFVLLPRHLVSVTGGDLGRWMSDLTRWLLLCSPCHYHSVVPFSVKRLRPGYLMTFIRNYASEYIITARVKLLLLATNLLFFQGLSLSIWRYGLHFTDRNYLQYLLNIGCFMCPKYY